MQPAKADSFTAIKHAHVKEQQPKLTDCLRNNLRTCHYNRRTEQTYSRVYMPYAFASKYQKVAAKWSWQIVFPQENRFINNTIDEQGRYHVHETTVQRVVKEAVRKTDITTDCYL